MFIRIHPDLSTFIKDKADLLWSKTMDVTHKWNCYQWAGNKFIVLQIYNSTDFKYTWVVDSEQEQEIFVRLWWD